MNLTAHRLKVEMLSAMATAKKHEMARRRLEVHRWNQKAFGRLDTLAWMFAAGALWTATSSANDEEGKLKRAVLGVANTALLASRLLDHPGPAEAGPGE